MRSTLAALGQTLSRSHSSDEVSVMEMERRAEQFKGQMDSQKYASISDEEDSSEDVHRVKLPQEIGIRGCEA